MNSERDDLLKIIGAKELELQRAIGIVNLYNQSLQAIVPLLCNEPEFIEAKESSSQKDILSAVIVPVIKRWSKVVKQSEIVEENHDA